MNGGEWGRIPHPPAVPPAPQLPGPGTINIPCYEGPDGRGPGTVSVTEEALKRHVFVTGATGSGKTTLLRSVMRQLIAWNAADQDRKVGLVVLDYKGVLPPRQPAARPTCGSYRWIPPWAMIFSATAGRSMMSPSSPSGSHSVAAESKTVTTFGINLGTECWRRR